MIIAIYNLLLSYVNVHDTSVGVLNFSIQMFYFQINFARVLKGLIPPRW